jgi:hypothetical protein
MIWLYLKSKWAKDNDVIPRHSPNLGASQGGAYTMMNYSFGGGGIILGLMKYSSIMQSLRFSSWSICIWNGVARSSRERCDGDDGSGWLSGITWCHQWTLLAWTLMPMQQLSNPVGYSRLHTLAHVAVDHKMVVCNLLIPNGTIDHTKLAVVYHQIQMNWCGGIQKNAYNSSTK